MQDVFLNEIVIPNDIIINKSNQSILRELSQIDFSTDTRNVYILWENFDTLEFSTTLFEGIPEGRIVCMHRPKKKDAFMHDAGEWSFYYDRHIQSDEDRKDVYHENMSRIKKGLFFHLDRFYNPYHEIDKNLELMKCVKDILDGYGINYWFVKPPKKSWYDGSKSEWLVTADTLVENYLEEHPLSHLLEGLHWLKRESFIGMFERELTFLERRAKLEESLQDGKKIT